jgi:hypothetical protein
MSPCLSVVVDITDSVSRRGTSSRQATKRAAVTLNIRFKLEAIDAQTLKAIENSTNQGSANSNTNGRGGEDFFSNVRTELELKQSFLQADTDKSGSVSSAELLKALAGGGTFTGTEVSGPDAVMTPLGAQRVPILLHSSSAAPQDKATRLLLSLARCSSAPVLDRSATTARDFEA